MKTYPIELSEKEIDYIINHLTYVSGCTEKEDLGLRIIAKMEGVLEDIKEKK